MGPCCAGGVPHHAANNRHPETIRSPFPLPRNPETIHPVDGRHPVRAALQRAKPTHLRAFAALQPTPVALMRQRASGLTRRGFVRLGNHPGDHTPADHGARQAAAKPGTRRRLRVLLTDIATKSRAPAAFDMVDAPWTTAVYSLAARVRAEIVLWMRPIRAHGRDIARCTIRGETCRQVTPLHISGTSRGWTDCV